MEANSQPSLWETKVNWWEVGLHALMGIGYVFFFALAFSVNNNAYDEFLAGGLCDLPGQLLFTYVTLYWLIPRFFLKKRYISYAALTLVLLSVATLLVRVLVYHYLLPHFNPELLAGQALLEPARLSRSTFYVLAPSSIMIAIHLMRSNYRQTQLNQQLANAKLSAELKLLKDQINPHFLFNTLNNLYGLTQKNHTKASEAVMRLSQLMHYMLYEGSRDRVPLSKEVECLQNYLELERIRYDNRLQLSFNVSGDIGRFSIAPLLLLPFVENAFKHGMRKHLGEAWLQISLQVEGSEMIFKVANSKPYRTKASD